MLLVPRPPALGWPPASASAKCPPRLPPACTTAAYHHSHPMQVLDILPGAAIVVAIMLLTGCMSPEQARRAIRWVSTRA